MRVAADVKVILYSQSRPITCYYIRKLLSHYGCLGGVSALAKYHYNSTPLFLRFYGNSYFSITLQQPPCWTHSACLPVYLRFVEDVPMFGALYFQILILLMKISSSQ